MVEKDSMVQIQDFKSMIRKCKGTKVINNYNKSSTITIALAPYKH